MALDSGLKSTPLPEFWLAAVTKAELCLLIPQCIGIHDHIHKDHKNQVDLFFQLFVYILQQFRQNLLKKEVL